jgi:hypothetical protein
MQHLDQPQPGLASGRLRYSWVVEVVCTHLGARSSLVAAQGEASKLAAQEDQVFVWEVDSGLQSSQQDSPQQRHLRA